jgi:hypothetical protein
MCSTPSCASAPPTWVGCFAVDRSGLGRKEIVRASIGVEAHRQPMRAEHLFQCTEGRGRPFLLDEKGRIDLPRGVFHGHNQIEQGLALA